MSDSNRDTIKESPPRLALGFRSGWLLAAVGLVLLLIVSAFLAGRWLAAVPPPGLTESTEEPTLTAPAGEPKLLASFRADFKAEQPKPGWRYCWNANGPVGNSNAYLDLVWNGQVFASTDQPVPTPAPAHYLRLSNTGGHPGQGPSQNAAIGLDYESAVIIGFTVPDAGRYAIVHSFILRRAGATHGSLRLQVLVNDRDTGSELYCRRREEMSFDRPLGHLAAGDTIYVCISPGDIDVSDSFDLDFAIGKY